MPQSNSLCNTMLSSAADYYHLLPISSSSEKATKSQTLAGTGSSLRQPVNSSYLKAEVGSSHIGGKPGQKKLKLSLATQWNFVSKKKVKRRLGDSHAGLPEV